MDKKVKDKLIQGLSLGFIGMTLVACSEPASSSIESKIELAAANDERGEVECRNASGKSVKLGYSYTELTNPHSISLFMNDQIYTVYESPASGMLYLTRDSINNQNEHLIVTTMKYGFIVESFFNNNGAVDYSTSKLLYDCINEPP